MERGIPEEEIAFIHDAKTDAQRDVLFKEMRTGKKKILIGSTDKCSTGVNVQTHLVAMHHVDCPWKPWKWQKKVYQSMELHLDAAIDKVQNLFIDARVHDMEKKWNEWYALLFVSRIWMKNNGCYDIIFMLLLMNVKLRGDM